MALGYSQNFDSLSTADLSGQDSFVASIGAINVVTDQTYQGAKSIKYVRSATTGRYYRALTSFTSSDFFVAVRRSANSTYGIFGVGLNSSFYVGWKIGWYGHGTGGSNLTIEDAAGLDVQTGYTSTAVDTWYVVNVQTQQATHQQARIRVHDGSWGSWTSWVNAYANIDSCDQIAFNAEDGGSAFNMWWDTVTESDPTASTTIYPRKALLGVGQ